MPNLEQSVGFPAAERPGETARPYQRDEFTPLQRMMLNDALGRERYAPLDPSRNPQAEDEYRRYCKWFGANDECIRFSHDSIRSRFRHGGHEHESPEDLARQLASG